MYKVYYISYNINLIVIKIFVKKYCKVEDAGAIEEYSTVYGLYVTGNARKGMRVHKGEYAVYNLHRDNLIAVLEGRSNFDRSSTRAILIGEEKDIGELERKIVEEKKARCYWASPNKMYGDLFQG